MKDETPIDRLQTLTAELQQVYQSLSASSQGQPAGQGAASAGGEQGQGDDGDDVIDAEFTTHE